MAKYFTETEFNYCTPSCSIKDMNSHFINLLDNIRERAGIPFILTCAYRSREWDLKKGRSGNSAHTKGLAVDIKYNSSADAFKIIESAMYFGIKRIGIGRTFIHLDMDDSLPQNVIWNYY